MDKILHCRVLKGAIEDHLPGHPPEMFTSGEVAASSAPVSADASQHLVDVIDHVRHTSRRHRGRNECGTAGAGVPPDRAFMRRYVKAYGGEPDTRDI